MLELKNLNKIYKVKDDDIDVEEVHAVKDISLTFERGEFVSILGLSGSGKTTLVSMIGGLEEPTSGSIFIDGIDTSSFKSKHWTDYRKNTIGFVFQDFNLIDHLTAIENIKIALSLSGLKEVEKESRAEDLLRMVGMLEQKNHFPSELSGGQQQRIAIARALANRPEIILADEPTGALDPDTSVQILNLLKDLAKQGHLVVMVTHNKYLARDYSTRIVELKDGEILRDEEQNETRKLKGEKVVMNKSTLQFGAALKIALNNLRKRKKSSIIALVSLVPSIIIVMIFGNFIFNVMMYQEDIDPLYKRIVNEPRVNYIAPQSEGGFELDIKSLLVAIDGKHYDGLKINKAEEFLYQPFSNEELELIESLDNIEKVFPPNYYDININGKNFLLVGLLPEAYKQFQYDLNGDYYPEDSESGLIMSKGTVDAIYNDSEYEKYEGEPVTFKVTSYNSVGIHAQTSSDQRNIFDTKILKVIDYDEKTVLMSSYYRGYIFAPYDYINTIRNSFSREDISIVSYKIADALSPEAANNKYLPDGAKYLTDLIAPVRSRTRFGDDLDIFTFKQYPLQIPSSNYMARYQIISYAPLTENDKRELISLGPLYRSQFDEFAVDSAIETHDFIDKLLLYAKIVVGVVVTVPSVLVTIILYISILLRTKEIGVLKSIGAKDKDIVTIFTLESGLLALIAGGIALAISFPILAYARHVLEAEYDVSFHLGSNPLDTNLIAFVGSLLAVITLTTLLGLLPGRKASKLHPRDLLRSIN
ncbi:MAG: ABC transporter ATP-binding protein/permease [Clostridia bacterium]|nr:ABC transporter ATP-binding protein/permease [Clostridia bacterium]